MLRYADPNEATVWVETDEACEVEVLDQTTRTFCVAGHHYAILILEGLEPDSQYPYSITLDGRLVWPERGMRQGLIRMEDTPEAEWPDALLLIGGQVYADEVSPAVAERIARRRPPDEGAGEEIANFEEYTWLYHEAWSDPAISWLLPAERDDLRRPRRH